MKMKAPQLYLNFSLKKCEVDEWWVTRLGSLFGARDSGKMVIYRLSLPFSATSSVVNSCWGRWLVTMDMRGDNCTTLFTAMRGTSTWRQTTEEQEH